MRTPYLFGHRRHFHALLEQLNSVSAPFLQLPWVPVWSHAHSITYVYYLCVTQ